MQFRIKVAAAFSFLKSRFSEKYYFLFPGGKQKVNLGKFRKVGCDTLFFKSVVCFFVVVVVF